MALLDSLPGVRYSGIHLDPRLIRTRASEEPPGQVPNSNRDFDWVYVDKLLRQAKFGQYVTAHLGPYEELLDVLGGLDYKKIVVVRDPRDAVLSSVAYMRRLKRHPQHRRFARRYANDRERVHAVINGFPADEFGPGAPPLRVRLEGFLPWLQSRGTLICRFEDLVGSRGGGSTDAQARAIHAIADHIDRRSTDEELSEVACRAWSTSSPTFRAGVIGQWRDRFEREDRELFEREVGSELLASYGYEPDD